MKAYEAKCTVKIEATEYVAAQRNTASNGGKLWV